MKPRHQLLIKDAGEVINGITPDLPDRKVEDFTRQQIASYADGNAIRRIASFKW